MSVVETILGYRRQIILFEIESIKDALAGWDSYSSSRAIVDASKDKKSVVLDVVTSHDISLDAKLSSHAVELGADISDHVKPGQKSIGLSCKLADLDFVGASFASLDKTIKEKMDLLESWVTDSKLLFYLGYSADKLEIPLVAITNLKIAKPLKGGTNSRDISISLTKLEVVESATRSLALKSQTKTKQSQGTKTTTATPAKPAVTTKVSSGLNSAKG